MEVSDILLWSVCSCCRYPLPWCHSGALHAWCPILSVKKQTLHVRYDHVLLPRTPYCSKILQTGGNARCILPCRVRSEARQPAPDPASTWRRESVLPHLLMQIDMSALPFYNPPYYSSHICKWYCYLYFCVSEPPASAKVCFMCATVCSKCVVLSSCSI